MSDNPLIKYECKIIAYIDILGFKGLVKNGYEAHDIYHLLGHIYRAQNFSEYMESARKNPTQNGKALAKKKNKSSWKSQLITHKSIKFSMFSDCFLISAPSNDHVAISILLYVIQSIQSEYLTEHGITCRGALHIGEVFHEGNVIFGPGVIDVYLMEKNAIYPRVILTKSMHSFLVNDFLHAKHIDHRVIDRDFDGYWFVNYFISHMGVLLFDDEKVDANYSIINKRNIRKMRWQSSNAVREVEANDDMDNYEKSNILAKMQWVLSMCDRYQEYASGKSSK